MDSKGRYESGLFAAGMLLGVLTDGRNLKRLADSLRAGELHAPYITLLRDRLTEALILAELEKTL